MKMPLISAVLRTPVPGASLAAIATNAAIIICADRMTAVEAQPEKDRCEGQETARTDYQEAENARVGEARDGMLDGRESGRPGSHRPAAADARLALVSL